MTAFAPSEFSPMTGYSWEQRNKQKTTPFAELGSCPLNGCNNAATPIFLLTSLASSWCSNKVLSTCGARRRRCSLVPKEKKRTRSTLLATQSLRGGTQHADHVNDKSSIISKFPSPVANPLWPDGVNEEDVNDLISICLQDPQLNIRGLPDPLERQLYKSTIRLTLNGIYHGVAACHGRSLLGHWISVSRTSEGLPEPRNAFRAALKEAMENLEFERDVEEDVLEMVADRMLANPDVNLRFLPDRLERTLYVNCLKVLFRVLNLLSATMTLTVCGHDMRIQLQTSTRYALQEAALRQSSQNMNKLTSGLDFEQIKNFVRVSNVVELSSDDLWFWQRWWSRWNPARNELMVQVHASLYSLLLSILDDLMDHTSIQILSDNIRFDVFPVKALTFQKRPVLRMQIRNLQIQGTTKNHAAVRFEHSLRPSLH